MRNSKKVMSLALVLVMLLTAFASVLSVSAAEALASYYSTNPDGKVGVQKTITIDGNASDWSEDMMIARSAAWDVANHYKGAHENSLIDVYALFASWDSKNLYIGAQFVNTTDTWQNSGDASLMDGGKMGDIPLILALSVDPSSTGMTGKVSGGKGIWDIDVSYETHVDHIFHMSAKPGLGTPAMFTAADSSGDTNYTSACKNFTTAGISYKLADTNICSNIYGLNDSNKPTDVYSDSANWVDFKTFKGSKGVHNTKYDTFYEMAIPLSALGIDANYIQSNGIGAMVIGTRGQSGMDCVPFDDTMLDNALGSYGSDPSTSHEKDDADVITVPLAQIGKSGGTTPVIRPTQPTTPATDPTQPTQPTQPSGSTLNVNATSNILTSGSYEAKTGDTISVKYDLKSSMKLCNAQWTMSYDPTKLKLKSSGVSMAPKTGGTVAADYGHVYGNFSEVQNLVDFSSGGTFVQAEFEVVGTGSSTVNLNVEELSVGYLSGGVLNYRNAVKNSTKQNLSGVSGFSSSSISGTTKVANGGIDSDDSLTINAGSNFFKPATAKLNADSSKVTVTYKLTSSMKLINSQWTLTYDNSKLELDTSDPDTLMPNVSNFTPNVYSSSEVRGNFTNINLQNFSKGKDFVVANFKVKGSGVANVYLNVNILGIAYTENYESVETYLVDEGVVKDVTKQPGFESETYTAVTSISSDSAVWGDVNLDGKLSIMDATVIQRYLSTDRTVKLSDLQLQIADTNGDGKVTIMDATVIQRRLAGVA